MVTKPADLNLVSYPFSSRLMAKSNSGWEASDRPVVSLAFADNWLRKDEINLRDCYGDLKWICCFFGDLLALVEG